METWFLVIAIYSGGTVSTSFGTPSTLGPMPSMNVCLDVAQAMERAAKGHIVAGCSIQITGTVMTNTAPTGYDLH